MVVVKEYKNKLKEQSGYKKKRQYFLKAFLIKSSYLMTPRIRRLLQLIILDLCWSELHEEP